MGEKSVTNILGSIKVARAVTLPRLLFALSIDHVGEETARLLAEHFGGIEKIRKAAPVDFERIPGIGETVAMSTAAWFQEEKNIELLERLLPELEVIAPRQSQGNEGY